MDFFFTFNKEKCIGFKKLSEPDMGFKSSSHGTHIGLYGEVLSFLSDRDVVKSAIFIYQDRCEALEFYFDRIKRADGTYNSPKIRKGDNHDKSVVVRIREIITQDGGKDWYLAWSGLESEDVVFWLIKGNSEDFQIARNFFPRDKMVLKEGHNTYNAARDFLLMRINSISTEIQKDIEVKSQIGDLTQTYKPKDIEKAERLYKQIGREGEELINQYLDREMFAGHINSYKWMNKSLEQGLPYDFIIDKKQL